MRKIIYIVLLVGITVFLIYIFDEIDTVPNEQKLEEAGSYVNAYKRNASKVNMYKICEINNELDINCANKVMSKFNLQHDEYLKYGRITFKHHSSFYHRLSPDGYVVLSVKNKENAPTTDELNKIVAYLNKYFKVTYDTNAEDRCTDRSKASFLQQLDEACFNEIISKYELSHEKYRHYWSYWSQYFITDNSNNKYPVVSLRSKSNIDSSMFWTLVAYHNEQAKRCLSDLESNLKNENNCDAYRSSLSSILPYLIEYTNDDNFKRRMHYNSTPEDAKYYKENETLMRQITKFDHY